MSEEIVTQTEPRKVLYRVRFIGASREQIAWGSNDDPNLVLRIGGVYGVVLEDVRSWHTKLTLDGFPGLRFNSASFETVKGGAS